MTMIRRSGRVRCRRFNNASARSLSRWRSWNSSSTTAPTPLSLGSESNRRVSTPSVTKRTRVCELTASSKRTWYPAVCPTCSPISDATRRAANRAAIRRGSSTTTSPLTISSKAGGTRVVLPAPGGASMTRLGVRLRDAIISGRISSTGSASLPITNFHRNTPHPHRQRHTIQSCLGSKDSRRNRTGAPGSPKRTWDENDGAKPLDCFYRAFTTHSCDHHLQ